MSTAPVTSLTGETLNALIASGAALLTDACVSFGHGTTNAQDEAAWLVLWSLGLPLDTPVGAAKQQSDHPITDLQLTKLEQLFRDRIQSRKPAAYLTREAWLQGVSFYIDERAIVPRSLIAELIVDGSIDAFLSESTHNVLDLCTGNGSLAILAAMAWPDVQITGADISTDALDVARINIDRHELQERIALVSSDGMAALPGPWDLIVCNPPYVNRATMLTLPPEYCAEPALALAGGEDGMDFVRQLLQHIPSQLSEDGVLLLEIGNERAHFESAFPELPVFWLQTSSGEDQVLVITRAALCGQAGLR